MLAEFYKLKNVNVLVYSDQVAIVWGFGTDADVTDEGDIVCPWEVEGVDRCPDAALAVAHGAEHLHQVRLQ